MEVAGKGDFYIMASQKNHVYTIADIEALPEGRRAELLDGRMYMMARGCHGAPDWVIEIVSPSSRQMDYHLKLPVYRETGVREYWIVDYSKQQVNVCLLLESDTPVTYRFTDTIPTAIYGDFSIDFSQLSEYLTG